MIHSIQYLKMKEFYNRNRKPILIAVVILIVGFLIYRSASNSSKSNLTPAVLSFESNAEKLTSDSIVTIKVDTKENKVGFVQVSVSFDPSKISLKEDLSPNPKFKTVIKNTSKEEANKNGEIVLAVGLEPGNAGQSGSFDIATLHFEPKESQEVTLGFKITDSQIVTMDAKPLTLEKNDLTIFTSK